MVKPPTLSRIKCPRCRKRLSIVFDECDMKKGIIVGYCYDGSHPRLKVKTVVRFRDTTKGIKCEMEKLTCIICGGKVWFDKENAFVAGGATAYDCPECKIGLRYLGRKVENCITYDEIIRVMIVDSRYPEWRGMANPNAS